MGFGIGSFINPVQQLSQTASFVDRGVSGLTQGIEDIGTGAGQVFSNESTPFPSSFGRNAPTWTDLATGGISENSVLRDEGRIDRYGNATAKGLVIAGLLWGGAEAGAGAFSGGAESPTLLGGAAADTGGGEAVTPEAVAGIGGQGANATTYYTGAGTASPLISDPNAIPATLPEGSLTDVPPSSAASLDPSGATAASPFGTGDTNVFTNPFTGGSNFNFGLPSVMGAYNLGTGLYGLYEADQMRRQAKQPQVYDPFASQRAQYQQQLAALAADPSLITKDPSYAAGLQAVMRSQAAAGYLGSGNMMTALMDYGGNFYNSAISRLAGLAGANISPVGTGINARVQANTAMSQALASIGFGLKALAS